jgi:hypothetical protein
LQFLCVRRILRAFGSFVHVLEEIFVLNCGLALRIALVLLAYAQAYALANPVTINFEGLPDSTVLTNQYPGLTFSNAIILTAGIGLNEFELPPHSGSNVAFDNNGPIVIAFSASVTSFSGYFTYVEPLALAALDASSNQVASAVSAFSSNDALFGDPGSSPNEFIQVTFARGFSSITIIGDPAGSSFAMDDIAYTPAVPEPHLVFLTFIGLAAIAAFRNIRSI